MPSSDVSVLVFHHQFDVNSSSESCLTLINDDKECITMNENILFSPLKSNLNLVKGDNDDDDEHNNDYGEVFY